MKTFTAKYDGKCAISGQKIVAGQTEIGFIVKDTVLAEYAGDRGCEYANGLIDQLAGLMEADGQSERAEQVRSERAVNEGPFRQQGLVGRIKQIQQRIQYWNED